LHDTEGRDINTPLLEKSGEITTKEPCDKYDRIRAAVYESFDVDFDTSDHITIRFDTYIYHETLLKLTMNGSLQIIGAQKESYQKQHRSNLQIGSSKVNSLYVITPMHIVFNVGCPAMRLTQRISKMSRRNIGGATQFQGMRKSVWADLGKCEREIELFSRTVN